MTGTSRRVASVVLIVALVVVLGALGCSRPSTSRMPRASEPTSAPWFERVSAESGLDFVYDSGHRQAYLMPEISGGGAALFDLEGDGDLDAYLVQSGPFEAPTSERPGNRLYRNRGDGTFEDITTGSGADHRGYGQGVAVGDFDGDGDADLYVTNVGPNALLRNDGNGRFSDVSTASGTDDSGWGASATFLDFDRDGDLDLFITNYLNWSPNTEIDCFNDLGGRDYCGPQNYNAPARDVLLRNDGPNTRGEVRFTDISREVGLADRFGTGLGVLAGDFNGDGWLDVFVANDGMPDQLWLHRGGTAGDTADDNGLPLFRDEALLAGCAVDLDGQEKAGMGVAVADLDDDDDLDLLVGNLGGESDSLFLNQGTTFSDVTTKAGLRAASRPFTRFGLGWADFDNDGLVDLFQANGRVMMAEPRHADDPYAEPDLLFRGRPGLRFEEVSPRGGTSDTVATTGRATAFGDLDSDGGIDVLVVNRDAPVHVLRNVVSNRGHWVLLRVLDEHGADAHHATVRVAVGARRLRRDVGPGSGYMASNDPRIHIGLGAHDHPLDIEVRWLDGTTRTFDALDVDRVHTLRKPAAPPSLTTSG